MASELQRMCLQGLAHHEAGRLADAESLYRQVLSQDPAHADSLHLLGVLAHQVGACEDAITLIEQAISVKRNVPAYYSNLGNALKDRGELAQAEAQYRKALRLKPDYADASSNLGLVLTSQGKLNEAVAAFRKALVFKPKAADIHNNLGIALRAQGKRREAMDCYTKAIALQPYNANAHNNLGNILRDEGRSEEAIASYRRAIDADPKLAEAHMNLGKVFSTLGQFDAAIACQQAALSCNPHLAEACVNLANIHIERGDRAAAMEWLHIAEERCGSTPFPNCHFHLGDLFARCDEKTRAEIHLRQHLAAKAATAPDVPGIEFLLAGLGIAAIPDKASDAQLQKLYAERAGTWDQKASAGTHSYQGHRLVANALLKFADDTAALNVLDIGCGTGLVGELIKRRVARISGIDSSTAMLAQAEGKGIYDELSMGDLFAHLSAAAGRFNAVTAAALLIHFGDLRPITKAVATALGPDGLFVFTVFAGHDGADISIASTNGLAQGGCYAHGHDYLARVAAEAGFTVLDIAEEVHEYIGEHPKTCFVVSLRKND